MQKLRLLLPLALFIGAFFMACHEEGVFDDGPVAKVTFVGRIIDEGGDGVPSALVKAGNESTMTDNNGVFRFEALKLPSMHAMLTVSKSGYFEISRPYIVKDGALQTVTIQLLAKTYAGSVSGANGGSISVPGGPKLNFPGGAITNINGTPFNGQVSIYARYLDPTDPKLALFVPGDMTAENASNEEVFLATYGMVGVEIESSTGVKLKIATGKEVELRMPIVASQQANAPAQIPLWHYDLEEGHWKEDGIAQKIGNEYVGKVSHFSFWNCDAPFPLTQLHGKVLFENANQPLANACIRITMLSTGASSFGYTDGTGRFGGCVPKNEALLLEVLTPQDCGGQVYYTENIGPLTGETTLPDIIIPASAQLPLLKVSGQLLSCNNQPIADGYVKIEIASNKYFVFSDANGQFGHTIIRCNNNPETGLVIGYDVANLLESASTTFTAPPNNINVGSLSVCTAVTEYIQYTYDGQQYNKIDPFGGLDVTVAGIWSNDSLNVAQNISFTFANSGQTGTFPLSSMHVHDTNFDTQAANTLSTTVTAFGPLGDFMIGTFGGNYLDLNGNSHTISGNYRVIREY